MSPLDVAQAIPVAAAGEFDRYAIRFVPRRPGSNWSETNRQLARRLLDEGRFTAAGLATLPNDL